MANYPVIISLEGSTDLVIPEDLDGMDGELRENNRINLLKVETDLEAIELWINAQFSEQTKKAYAKEADRLLLWCYKVAEKPLSSLYRSDYDDYKDFMLNPPASWCGPRRKRTSKEWRPFVAPLSEKSATQALIIIKALLSYLVQNSYLAANPLSGKLKKSTDDEPSRMAFLPQEWQYILNAADDLPPSDDEAEYAKYERGRWLVRLMIGTGLRISEIATHTMGAFRESQNANGEIVWRFYVKGKGDKKAWVPVSSRLLKALKRYRVSQGLTALPNPSDINPLIANMRTGKEVTSRRLHQLLTEIFDKAAESIEVVHPHRAEKLRNAKPHTIRHTAITELGKTTDIRIQQKFARHSDIKTTMIYNHIEDDRLQDAVEDSDL